jgi:hypothetical protein
MPTSAQQPSPDHGQGGRPDARGDRRRHDRGGRERRRVPPLARSPVFAAVGRAWRAACDAFDPGHAALALALAAYARDGRERGVPVAVLLRALDTVVRPADGGDPALDAGGIRARAGTALIRAYYGGDQRAEGHAAADRSA